MKKHVRYTCNQKNEPTTRDNCKSCPEYNPCAKDGKWCFVGALVSEEENKKVYADIVEPIAQDAAMPVLRDMSTATINLGNGQSVDVLREEFRKSIEDELYKSIRPTFLYGA